MLFLAIQPCSLDTEVATIYGIFYGSSLHYLKTWTRLFIHYITIARALDGTEGILLGV